MKLILGDCLDKLKEMDDNSIDSIVTDPPAGISFMNKAWDKDKGDRDQWIKWLESIMVECLRVLKPGGHALVWALPRTSHWTAFAIENAGFEIRDCIQHVFGSGFPKNMDISKQIDKAKGEEREVVGQSSNKSGISAANGKVDGSTWGHVAKYTDITAPSSEEAKQWDGWGSSLKPAHESWWLCRKPISEKTIADNVLKHGTGGINVDGTRIMPTIDDDVFRVRTCKSETDSTFNSCNIIQSNPNQKGRWPSNFIMSHDERCFNVHEVLHEDFGDTLSNPDGDFICVDGCPIKMMDEQSGVLKSGNPNNVNSASGGVFGCSPDGVKNAVSTFGGTSGTASRYFPNFTPEYDPFHYFAKASVSERNDGCDENTHPTIKSLSLMRWLITLITPPKGIVLDPFMGSGSTGCAAAQLGFDFIGIEKELEYMEIAKKRIQHAKNPHGQFSLF